MSGYIVCSANTVMVMHLHHAANTVNAMEHPLAFRSNVRPEVTSALCEYAKDTPRYKVSLVDARIEIARACKTVLDGLDSKGDRGKLESAAVLTFDAETQLPTTSQISREAETKDNKWTALSVAEWFQSSSKEELGMSHAFSDAVVAALRAHHLAAVAAEGVDMQARASSGKRCIVAARRREAEALEFWPRVRKSMKVAQKSTHPEKVRANVHVKKADSSSALEHRIVNIHPDVKLPTNTTPADVEPHGTTWEWDTKESMQYFWAVTRLTAAERQKRASKEGSALALFNVELPEKETAVAMPAKANLALAITMPALANTAPVEKGKELSSEVSATAEKETKSEAETWRTDEARQAKKFKT
ncbi:unnamed protein product, partial [Prorocentrum cordatum]